MRHLRGLGQIRSLHSKYLKKWLESQHKNTSPDIACEIASFYIAQDDDRQAFQWLLQSARGGNPIAQFNLALCCLRGQGTAVNMTQATRWLKMAAAKVEGAQRALKALALYGPGAVRLMPFIDCPRFQVQLATISESQGQDLDTLVLCGIDKLLNSLESKTPNELMIQAAIKGQTDGQFVLGWWYHTILHDHAKAHEWYSKALKNSKSPYVHYHFALLYFETRKYDFYTATMSTAANALEYTPAQLHLGQQYLSGKYIERDTQQGIWLLESAANCKSAEAMYELGTLYRLGDGVPQDLERSFEWYQRAGDESSAEAFYWMAVLKGFDTEDGRRYLEMAAKYGAMLAQNDLGTVLAQEKQFAEAKHWLRKASERGDRTASDNLHRLQRHVMGRCLPPVPGVAGLAGIVDQPRFGELL